jgi:hypothetical protein
VQVCRLFKNVDDSSLQYKIELVLAGMQDGPPSNLTSNERLRMLRSHQEAWSTLSWTEKETIPMLSGDTWELFGGVLALADGPKTLVLRQLPSRLRGLETSEWKIDVDVPVRDFSMDKDQDLLVIVDGSEWVEAFACYFTTCLIMFQKLQDPSAHTQHWQKSPIGCFSCA